jgi:gas vesicle protein
MSHYDNLPYVVVERRGGGVGAFLMGALCGAAAALLFAPRSGRETREELRVGALRLKDRAEETVRSLQDSVVDTIDNVRDEVTDRIDMAREAFEAGRQAARETRRDMERRVDDARARVRAGIEAAKEDPHGGRAMGPAAAPRSEADAESGIGV